jgi:hypothetical protein
MIFVGALRRISVGDEESLDCEVGDDGGDAETNGFGEDVAAIRVEIAFSIMAASCSTCVCVNSNCEVVGSENVDGEGGGVCVGTGAYVNRGGGFGIDGAVDVGYIVEFDGWMKSDNAKKREKP